MTLLTARVCRHDAVTVRHRRIGREDGAHAGHIEYVPRAVCSSSDHDLAAMVEHQTVTGIGCKPASDVGGLRTEKTLQGSLGGCLIGEGGSELRTTCWHGTLHELDVGPSKMLPTRVAAITSVPCQPSQGATAHAHSRHLDDLI